MLARIKSPSEGQAKALGNLFFNPKAECVAKDAHGKRKKFESTAKIPASKDSAVTVILLKKYHTRIPRGDFRQELVDGNCVKKIALNRTMTPNEVKGKILTTFGCEDFILLECAKGGYLLKAKDRILTSQLAIDRRGALYLCEKSVIMVVAIRVTLYNRIK